MDCAPEDLIEQTDRCLTRAIGVKADLLRLREDLGDDGVYVLRGQSESPSVECLPIVKATPKQVIVRSGQADYIVRRDFFESRGICCHSKGTKVFYSARGIRVWLNEDLNQIDEDIARLTRELENHRSDTPASGVVGLDDRGPDELIGLPHVEPNDPAADCVAPSEVRKPVILKTGRDGRHPEVVDPVELTLFLPSTLLVGLGL